MIAEYEAEAKQLLRRAAELIGELGWNQGDYRDKETGAVCALGAIGIARGEMSERISPGASFEAERMLAKHIGRSFVAPWNDAPDRTAEDVILALKKAAES